MQNPKLQLGPILDCPLGYNQHAGRTTLDEASVTVTLGSVLKYREDQERVLSHGVADLVRTAILRGA